MKALEKAEAKLKQKLEKRNARNLYEGSKLMEAQNNKKSYEELFLEVNPLQTAGQNKGKSKDIHLENIDVSPTFPSLVSNRRARLKPSLISTGQLRFPPHLVERYSFSALWSVSLRKSRSYSLLLCFS